LGLDLHDFGYVMEASMSIRSLDLFHRKVSPLPLDA
jgi:hypothetical protein